MKKILVIEDNPEILDNTKEILELSNYKVITAENGKKGVEQAISQEPDLILCDIMMPDLDGYGVLHMLQKHPRLRYTPFIFLTAKTEQVDIRKGMSLGADDYITKPFDLTDLLNAIESRLKKSEFIQMKMKEESLNEEGATDIVPIRQVITNFVEGRHVDHFKKRQRIFSEGNHPNRLYYVVSGKVKIYKTNEEGKELIMKIVKPCEFFGYVAIVENTVYKENADALEDCDIAVIPRSDFEILMKSNAALSRLVLKKLAVEVSEKEEQLVHIAYDSLRRKVADALLNLREKYNDRPGDFNIHLSRENFAAVAGTATESLIRTITHFKSEKLIDIKDGRITVLDPERLSKMIN